MKRYSKLLILTSILLFIQCSDDSSDPVVPILTTIEVTTTDETTFDVSDDAITLTARGLDQNGDEYTFTEAVVWSSDNSNASVDADGKVQGLAEGTSVVSASSEGISGSITLTISDIFSQDYHIYVSDAAGFQTGPWKIVRYDQNGENPSTFISTNLGWPQDILFMDDGSVLISNLSTGIINKHDQTTGDLISAFATGIGGPTRMKIGPDGLLYVLQWQGDGKVKRYQLDGTFVDDFTASGVTRSIGLDWDADGNLYVASFNGATVRKFDTSGADLGVFVTSANLQGPTNIWFDDDGNLIVNDYSGGVIAKFDQNGDFVENLVTGLIQVEGIAFLPNGNFLVGNGGTAEVKMYDSNNNFVEDFVDSGVGGLITPNAVVRKDLN